MLDRTCKRVGHGRERDVGNGRRGIRRGGEIASFPDPAQLSGTCSTVKQERAWYSLSRE